MRLDSEALGTKLPKSIQSGYEIWTRMMNVLTDQMYRMFEDVNDIKRGQGKRLVIAWRYSVKPIRIEYFDHVVQMDQSESWIFTFHSDDVTNTGWAPEH